MVVQRDEAQRAMSDVVAEKDAALAAKEEALAAKEKADAERVAAAAAKEASEAALVAMTAERDAAVSEKEAALAEMESSRKEDESLSPQMDVTQKTAQKKIKELTKANDSLTNDNAALKVLLFVCAPPPHPVVELIPWLRSLGRNREDPDQLQQLQESERKFHHDCSPVHATYLFFRTRT